LSFDRLQSTDVRTGFSNQTNLIAFIHQSPSSFFVSSQSLSLFFPLSSFQTYGRRVPPFMSWRSLVWSSTSRFKETETSQLQGDNEMI
jgi:hypothetical protein